MRPATDAPVRRIGFLLIPGFALMSFAAASEPFRAANLIAGRPLYEILAFAEAPGAVRSSGIATVSAAGLPGRGCGLDTLFVCAGGSPADWHRPAVHAALRTVASEGVAIGGISGGPYVLAAGGLLARRRFTIHWEHAPALREAFPDLSPEQARFVIDRDRLTCGGGVAPLDMMHALIAERMGADFARRVSDWFLHADVAEAAGPQRASLAERYGVHHPALVTMLAAMEANVETPLPRTAMARLAGISPRHVDRLFTQHRAMSFSEAYRRVRLDHAKRLLHESPLRVAEIAFATGFSSAGHFSRSYRAVYGSSPSEARRRRGTDIGN